MKITLIRPAIIGGERLEAGSDLDLAPVHAQALIDGGKAELVEESPRKAVIEPPETPEAPLAEIPPDVLVNTAEDPPPEPDQRARKGTRKKT